MPLENYLFYLAFEDYICDQFITEKTFKYAYGKGAVPIIMGSSTGDMFQFLPPYSYLRVLDFLAPEDLAKRLWFINKTIEDSYWKFHEWRRDMEVLEEYTPSSHFCRMCEALNYNDKRPKVYRKEELQHFLDPLANCHNNWW